MKTNDEMSLILRYRVLLKDLKENQLKMLSIATKKLHNIQKNGNLSDKHLSQLGNVANNLDMLYHDIQLELSTYK